MDEDIDKIKEMLRTVFSKSTKVRAKSMKVDNIKSFANLDRNNLKFEYKERQMLVHVTQAGERIFIRFPGKESIREGDRIRPWDFRPKIMLANGSMATDISFKNIWDDLTDIADSHPDLLSILATTFFRMAYLIDHKKYSAECDSAIYEYGSNCLISENSLTLTWYKYEPNPELISFLQSKIGNIRGMSIEAYLMMNDFLAQNEDCKYYYRDKIVSKKEWDEKIGRSNNLLTHMATIGFLQKNIRFTEITDRFQRGRGVAPISTKEIPLVTEGMVTIV